jgi:hypothetical protein
MIHSQRPSDDFTLKGGQPDGPAVGFGILATCRLPKKTANSEGLPRCKYLSRQVEPLRNHLLIELLGRAAARSELVLERIAIAH